MVSRSDERQSLVPECIDDFLVSIVFPNSTAVL